jgi:hypothetical protein
MARISSARISPRVSPCLPYESDPAAGPAKLASPRQRSPSAFPGRRQPKEARVDRSAQIVSYPWLQPQPALLRQLARRIYFKDSPPSSSIQVLGPNTKAAGNFPSFPSYRPPFRYPGRKRRPPFRYRPRWRLQLPVSPHPLAPNHRFSINCNLASAILMMGPASAMKRTAAITVTKVDRVPGGAQYR